MQRREGKEKARGCGEKEEEEEEKEAEEEGREAKYGGGGWEEGGQTSLSGGRSGACGVRGRSGGRSIMMQRWRGCGTLELARALAIGRSANHSFGNNRLHTLHTKDTREPAEESPRSGAASPPISTYDPETSSSPLPIRSFSASFSVSKPIETSLSPRLLGKRNSSPCLYRFADNNDLSSPLSNLFQSRSM